MTDKIDNDDGLIDLSHPPKPTPDQPKPDVDPDEEKRFHALEFENREKTGVSRTEEENERAKRGKELWKKQLKTSEREHVHVEPGSFAPPPPKEAIFHSVGDLPSREGRDDLSGSGSFIDSSDPEPPVSLKRSKLDVDTDDWSQFSDRRNIFRENAWARNPGNIALAILVSVALMYFYPGRITFLLGALIFTVFTSYWLAPWNRDRYRYNMDWEADADPVGCGGRGYGYRSWWWWW